MVAKKTTVVAMLLSLVLASVWAGAQKEAVREGPRTPDPVVLTFWFPQANPTEDAYFQSLGPRFMSKHPHIKIETTVTSGRGAEIEQTLNTAKLSGTFPDVMSALLLFMGTRGSRGDFMDITEYFNEWDGKDDFLEAAIEMGKYRGTLMGLGFYPAPIMNVYRKDFYAEAGLDPERGPSNWREFREFANKAAVRDASGNLVRAGQDIPISDVVVVIYEHFARQAGSMVVDEINQKPAFTDDGSIEALQFLSDVYNDGVSFPHEMTRFGEAPFVNNRSARGFPLTSMVMNIIKEDPALEDKLGYGPVTEHREKRAFCGYRNLIIGSECKHPDEAWEFIKFVVTPQEMWDRYEALAIPPVRKSLTDRYIAHFPARNAAIYEHIEFGKGKPITPWTSIYDKYMNQAYQEAISRTKTARQALTDAYAGLTEELKRFQP